MDTSINTGEAQPSQNTAKTESAPNLNPLTFDEAALAKMLQKRFSESEQIVEENPKPEASSDEVQVEVEAQTSDKTGDQDESPELDPSQQEQDEQPEEADQSSVQKRINKLTAQRKEAQAKAEALERELNEAKSKLEELSTKPEVAPVASMDNPFSDVWDDAKLTEEWNKARDLKRWCEDNQDGCELNGKEYTREDIKQIRRKVEDALDLHIPKRAAFIQQHRQIKPIAENIYPWWKDRSAVEYTEAQSVIRQMPQIAQLPEYQVLIGDFIEGRKLRMAREKTASKPAAKAPAKIAPKQPGTPASSPARVDTGKAELNAAKSKFLKSGGQAELTQLLKRALV